MIRFFYFFVFLFFCAKLLCQHNYDMADSVAFDVSSRKYTSITKLTKALTKDLSNDLDKFRSIFRWITINIEYEIGSKISAPSEVLRKKKCVCKGYANLLKAMCDAAKLKCVYVSGWAKGQIVDINWRFKKNQRHGWNAVNIDGKWMLCDVTWASSIDIGGDTIVQEFDESYFIMEPELFALQHFPADKKWLFTDQNKIEFKRQPVYYPKYFDFSDFITIANPDQGHCKYQEIAISDTIYDFVNELYFQIYGVQDTIIFANKVKHDDGLLFCHFDFKSIKKKSKAVLKYKNTSLIGFYIR